MNFDSADIQMYARIVLYWLAGVLVAHGFGTDSTWQPIVGFLVTLINFAWTLYGNRLLAKINALADTGQVSAIVVHDKATANAAPSPIVISSSDATVVMKPK